MYLRDSNHAEAAMSPHEIQLRCQVHYVIPITSMYFQPSVRVRILHEGRVCRCLLFYLRRYVMRFLYDSMLEI